MKKISDTTGNINSSKSRTLTIRKFFKLSLIVLLALVASDSWGQLLQQDFSSSTVVTDYVSATPTNGQFNAIGTSGAGVVLSINTTTSNKLRFARAAANAGSFSRTTDFSPTPTSMYYRFDLTVSGNSVAQTTAGVFQVGSGFGTANAAEANASVHSRIGVNWTTTAGQFSIRNLSSTTNSANYSGKQTITWVINNSGGSLSYLAPDGSCEAVANDCYDLWIGTTKEFNDGAATTTTQTLSDLKFAFTGGTGTIDIDNILIDPIIAAPTSNAASGITNSGFTANWTTVSGVTGYRLDVSTASDFSSFVTGYNNLVVSGQATSSQAVSGLSPSTTYYYRVRAENAYTVGTITSCSSGTQNLTTTVADVTPPTVSTYSPADGSTTVGTSDNLVLTYNENVVVGTAGTIIVYNSGGTIFESIPYNDARITFNGTTSVTINPTANLVNGNAYYVQITATTAIKDVAGNGYAGITDNSTWNFTAVAGDVTPPTVSTYSPADGSTTVGINDNLVLTFNENVVVGTSGSIVIYNSGTFETIPYSDARITFSTNTVTINPSGTFANSTAYYVQIGANAIRDVAGNFYAGISDAITWNFTTVAGAATNETVNILQYNLLNYVKTLGTGDCDQTNNNYHTKGGYLKTIIGYAQPDIFGVEEIQGGSGGSADANEIHDSLLNILNASPGYGSGVWARLPYSATMGNEFISCQLYWNTNKFTHQSISYIDISGGGGTTRDVPVEKLKFYKNDNVGNPIYLYVLVTHTTPSTGNEALRASEMAAVRAWLDANLASGENIVMMGDFNLYTSTETAYQNLISGGLANTRLYDPLNRPGTWSGTSSFTDIHTQCTRLNPISTATDPLFCGSTGGGDDRFDFVLATNNIINGTNKISYVSYETVGQDGLHYNLDINNGGNSSPASAIVNELYQNSDHLPVKCVLEFECGATLTSSVSTLTGFTYVEGSGPSTNQTFTISGSGLSGTGNITVTGSTNYEVSTDGTTFAASVTYPYASGVITGQPKTVYVRLIAGLAVGAYNGETIAISGGSATTINVTCSGDVSSAVACTFGESFDRADATNIGNGWTEIGGDAAIVSNELVLSSTTTSEVEYIYQDVNAIYETTFDNLTSPITWEFNMRQSRTDPSGLASGSYGSAFILGNSGSDFTVGTGYAVTQGNSVTPDPIKLVKYSAGVDGALTQIIAGISPTNDHTSVRVTFEPATNTWELFTRNDGATAFADPASLGAGNSNGTAVDATHITTDLPYIGCYYAHATGATEKSEFDKICISNVPAPTLTSSVSTLTGFTYVEGSGPSTNQTFTISGSALVGTGNITVTGSTNYLVSTDGTTFAASVTYPYASGIITSQPKTVYVRLKAGLTTASYNSENIVVSGGSATSINIACSGTVTAPPTPTLTSSVSILTGFTYIFGAGPSANQTFTISGSALVGTGNITVTGSTNYLVSTDGTTFAASVTYPYASGVITSQPKTVYVRLKSGLAVGTYNSENIVVSGGSATSINVTCSGSVTTSTLTSSVSTVSGFTYVFGAGPSANQTFTISGSSLIGTGNITVTGTTNYLVSTDGTTFAASVTCAYASGVITAQPKTVYVRLKAGLAVGDYNSENITIAGGSATTINVTCSGTVTAVPAGPTAWINEFHYDDASTDAGEMIEIVINNPGDYTLSLFRVDVYNGADGTSYGNGLLSTFTVGVTSGTATIYTKAFAGMQNGPDGIALSYNGTLIQFLSYGGSFAGTAGVAIGVTATNVGAESGSVEGQSLQLAGSGCAYSDFTWQPEATQTMGLVNNGQTLCTAVVPTITVSTTTKTGFSYYFGSGPSVEQSFTVSGTNLTANISITAPTNYEISTGTGGSFVATSPITLTQSGGTVNSTTIYIRLKAGLAIGSYNLENISLTSTGATTKTVSCSGNVSAAANLFISEVAGYGMVSGTYDNEYIELINNLATPQSLDGWQLLYYENGVLEETITFGAANIIPANDAFVIAVRATNTIAEDYLASFTINNATCYVVLKDNFGNIYDEAGSSSDPFDADYNYEFTDCGADNKPVVSWNNKLLTDGTPGVVNCVACVTPTVKSTALTFSLQTAESMKLTWANGNGTNRIVIARPGSSVSLTPVNGTTYSANSIYADGADLGSGNKCVYNGNGTNVTVTGLNGSTMYYYAIYEYNCSPANELYYTSALTGNQATTLSPVTGLNVVCQTNTTAEVSWTAPIGDYTGVIIGIRSSATLDPHTISADASTYTANAIFGSGTQYGSTTPYSFVVYKGTGTSVTITGLTAGQPYILKAYAYKNETSTIVAATLPTTSISSLGTMNVTGQMVLVDNAQLQLQWTNPGFSCFDEIMIVAKAGAAITTIPTGDGSAYNANLIYGSGSAYNGGFVVYKGVFSPQMVTGLTNGTSYCFTWFTRNGTQWSTGVSACATPANITILYPGDLAIVAVNTQAGAGSDDEICFFAFKTIASGTAIDFTDNGYERLFAGKWADSEGTIRLLRTGADIPAGQVICFQGMGNTSTGFSMFTCGNPDDAGWTISSLNSTGSYDLNVDDQIWIMQGGSWNYGGSLNNHDAVYSGNILYGWTATGWKPNPGYNSTAGSTIFSAMECFNTDVMVSANHDKVKYIGTTAITSQFEWITRINDDANWAGYASNNAYENGPDYVGTCITFANSGLINIGSSGVWTGLGNEDWFDCGNWQNLRIPSGSVNVSVSGVVANDITVDNGIASVPEAECNNLTIAADATVGGAAIKLKVNDANSILNIYGNMENNQTIQHTNGAIHYKGNFVNNDTYTHNTAGTAIFDGSGTQSLSGTATTFFNLQMNNSSSGLTLLKDININGTLTLTLGTISSSASPNGLVIMNSGSVASGGSNASYINGPMQKIGSTAFTFPVGKSGKWARLGIASSSNVANAFKAEYFKTGSPNNSLSNMNAGLDHVSFVEYWNIDKMVGSDYPAVTLYWDDASTVVELVAPYDSIQDLRVAHWNGTKWDDMNGGVSNLAIGTWPFGQITSTVAFSSYSPITFGSKTGKNPLPVDLLNFNAKRNKSVIDLNWETLSERNNDYFMVERSTDAYSFSDIGKVKGMGNSNSLNNYFFTDGNPLKNMNYYRLKQTDFDGKYSYSNIIAVDLSTKPQFSYSDFISDKGNVSFIVNNPDQTWFNIKITDVLGRIIYSKDYRPDAENIQIYITDIKMNSGIYYFMIYSNNQVITNKFFVK